MLHNKLYPTPCYIGGEQDLEWCTALLDESPSSVLLFCGGGGHTATPTPALASVMLATGVHLSS